MLDSRNAVKLVLALTVILLLTSAAFLVGYEVGNSDSQNSSTAAATTPKPTISSQSQALPTATARPTVTVAPPTTIITKADQQNPTPGDNSPIPPSPTPPEPETTPTQGATVETTKEPELTDEEALHVLQEAWDLLDAEFYGDLPSPEERVYAAIRGMLDTLDDEYTSFSEPSIAAIRRADASGEFEGIGALVTMNDDDILEIVETFADSPAENAGLRQGDLVLAVDGESIVGYGVFDAITLIRGPEGTEVELSIKRGDADPFQVRIVRARLDIPIIESRILDDGIGYVRLFDFSSMATTRLEEALEELFEQGAAALILDLRGNPGGFLDQAVQVADLFLEEGLILVERRSDGQQKEFTSTDEGLAQDVPLVVLVNGGSASASEIVAGAIQDRGRGTLIGEMTFGKGSVQLLHTLSDGSELRVTVARWFTPADLAIHGEGLTPDIEIPITQEDQDAGLDPQLERAVELLETGQ